MAQYTDLNMTFWVMMEEKYKIKMYHAQMFVISEEKAAKNSSFFQQWEFL